MSSLTTFVRTQITKLEKQMLELAEKTVSAPLSQVDYLIVVGKYRGLKSTRDSYTDMLRKEVEPEQPDDDLESEVDGEPQRATVSNPVRKPPRPIQRARSWGGR